MYSIVDAFSRTIVRWRVAAHMRTSMFEQTFYAARRDGLETVEIP